VLGQLGAGLTHEVKNPLSAILGYAELLGEEAGDPASVREHARVLHSAAKRALGIITRVLVYARPGNEERSWAAPEAFIREAVALVRHQMQMARLHFSEEVPDGLPAVHANAGQLQQVLVNLLVNARDATPAGGHVSISAAAEGGHLVVRVKDDGSGMPTQVRQRLFEPFFTTKGDGEGTGLGLSVSHAIVESHGGTIRVESEPGRGSTFEVVLPLMPQRPEGSRS
jgi:signal transduction histidine kinase